MWTPTLIPYHWVKRVVVTQLVSVAVPPRVALAAMSALQSAIRLGSSGSGIA